MYRRIASRLKASAALGFALALGGLLVPSASASPTQPRIVSEIPARTTPHAVDDAVVSNAAVMTFSQSGNVMYAGGLFHKVQNPALTGTYLRQNLFSFSIATGTPTGWAPHVNGTVLKTLVYGGYLYVGGSFTVIDGVPSRLVRYSLATLKVDTAWKAAGINGSVSDLDVVSGRLLVSGSFTRRLLSLSLYSGANLGYFTANPISGTVAANAGLTSVYRFAVNPSHTRMLAIGNFTTVGKYSRTRAVMFDLGTTATVDPWYYLPLRKMCGRVTMPEYLRDVDFSPDGSYFVVASTGRTSLPGDLGHTLCDAAARFETSIPNPAKPTWINYTGGDTLLSIAAVGPAVYVGGHQRWLNNPYGVDSCGTGCVPREGVGAIDPVSGKALAWNPGKTRGFGTSVIYPTPTGIWWGSDGRLFHGAVHDSIAFTPLS
ncbi:MAG: hypothetical protein ABJC62_12815 [Frankiaceae bacterium]